MAHSRSWGKKGMKSTQCFLHFSSVLAFLASFFSSYLCALKISMNAQIWCLLKVHQQFIDPVFHPTGCFTCCCDRNPWDSCKNSWMKIKSYNFSCSFSSLFNYCCIHCLPWIGSHFPVHLSLSNSEREKKIIVWDGKCHSKAPTIRL